VISKKERNKVRKIERKKRERGGKERKKIKIIHCDCQTQSHISMALSLGPGSILPPTLREINSDIRREIP
jgi:helix-turn-helix protein